MAGLGRSGQGSGGSGFNSDNHDFPGVPFGPNDFTPRDLCPSANGQFNIICYARSFWCYLTTNIQSKIESLSNSIKKH